MVGQTVGGDGDVRLVHRDADRALVRLDGGRGQVVDRFDGLTGLATEHIKPKLTHVRGVVSGVSGRFGRRLLRRFLLPTGALLGLVVAGVVGSSLLVRRVPVAAVGFTLALLRIGSIGLLGRAVNVHHGGVGSGGLDRVRCDDGELDVLLHVAFRSQRPVPLKVGLRAQGQIALKGHGDGDLIGVKMVNMPQNHDDGPVVHHVRNRQHGRRMVVSKAVRVERNAVKPGGRTGVEHFLRAHDAGFLMLQLLSNLIFDRCGLVFGHQQDQ